MASGYSFPIPFGHERGWSSDFTNDLEEPYLSVMRGMLRKPDFLLKHPDAHLLASILWSHESEMRATGEPSCISQPEYFIVTRAIGAFCDYHGVYLPRFWEFYLASTEDHDELGDSRDDSLARIYGVRAEFDPSLAALLRPANLDLGRFRAVAKLLDKQSREQGAEESSPEESSHEEFGPAHRTRPMSCADAGKYLGLPGNQEARRKTVRRLLEGGDLPYEQMGSLYVFDRRKFPAEVQSQILPDV